MESGTPPVQSGVNKCYMFKSRLQEYAQKAGFKTPEYHTTKEGMSHDPEFRSTVSVNGVNYDSLSGFCTRKEAEQSAAEVALLEIVKLGVMKECVPSVHETGLCKNLLQEYSQRMNYTTPLYICNKQGVGPSVPYICTVEIGGIQYIGASARTKKEAEIKAARTALLAIQSTERGTNGTTQYTVLPVRKKAQETEKEEDVNSIENRKLKAKKKNMFKKKKKWIEKKKLLQKKNCIPTGEDQRNGEEFREVEECEEKKINCDLGLGLEANKDVEMSLQ